MPQAMCTASRKFVFACAQRGGAYSLCSCTKQVHNLLRICNAIRVWARVVVEMGRPGSLGQNVVVGWVCQMSLQVGPGALVGDHSLCAVAKDGHHSLQVHDTKSGLVQIKNGGLVHFNLRRAIHCRFWGPVGTLGLCSSVPGMLKARQPRHKLQPAQQLLIHSIAAGCS